jgi:hypothetical protein
MITEQTRQKMSQSHKGKHYHSEQHKQELRRKMLGNNYGSLKKGFHQTLEARLKMSIAKKGKAYRKGSKHSAEAKLKISQARIGKFGGSNHWNWKGGVTSIHERIRKSAEYRLWRKAVYERDGYRCVWCGIAGNGQNLEADHIKPFALFPELRLAIDNGRTLCKDCHKKTNTYGWKTYHNRKSYAIL